MRTAYISHPSFLEHDMNVHGSLHPECPQRLQAIHAELTASGVLPQLATHLAPAASDEQLLRAHSGAHLQYLKDSVPTSGYAELDPALT